MRSPLLKNETPAVGAAGDLKTGFETNQIESYKTKPPRATAKCSYFSCDEVSTPIAEFAVYDGRRRLGTISETTAGCAAIDLDGQIIGSFRTRIECARAFGGTKS